MFLIHPLIENAVKHGMNTSPTPLEIAIKSKVTNRMLVLEIINTGEWIERSNIDCAERT